MDEEVKSLDETRLVKGFKKKRDKKSGSFERSFYNKIEGGDIIEKRQKFLEECSGGNRREFFWEDGKKKEFKEKVKGLVKEKGFGGDKAPWKEEEK